MFERISFREESPPTGLTGLDLGAIAEALIFYGEVSVVGARGVLLQLTKAMGPEVLTALVANGFLKFVFQPNYAVVHTRVDSGVETFDAGLIEAPALTLDRVLPPLFVDSLGQQGRARRLARKFIQHADVRRIPEGLGDQFRTDFRNEPWVHSVVSAILDTYAPSIANGPWMFQVAATEPRFSAVTDINFASLNSEYHKVVPPAHSTLNSASFLAHIVHIRELAHFAASENSELGVNGLDAVLLQRLIQQATGRQNSRNELKHFQDFVFDDGRALREVINTGKRSFADLLPLLERSKDFRKWISGVSVDQRLVKEYFREVTKDSWVDRLPARGLRWVFFTAMGLGLDLSIGSPGVASALGSALGFGDEFLLDRLVQGWRPHHFVNGPLREFVGQSKSEV